VVMMIAGPAEMLDERAPIGHANARCAAAIAGGRSRGTRCYCAESPVFGLPVYDAIPRVGRNDGLLRYSPNSSGSRTLSTSGKGHREAIHPAANEGALAARRVTRGRRGHEREREEGRLDV